jgi:hypothetical protein
VNQEFGIFEFSIRAWQTNVNYDNWESLR